MSGKKQPNYIEGPAGKGDSFTVAGMKAQQIFEKGISNGKPKIAASNAVRRPVLSTDLTKGMPIPAADGGKPQPEARRGDSR